MSASTRMQLMHCPQTQTHLTARLVRSENIAVAYPSGHFEHKEIREDRLELRLLSWPLGYVVGSSRRKCFRPRCSESRRTASAARGSRADLACAPSTSSSPASSPASCP